MQPHNLGSNYSAQRLALLGAVEGIRYRPYIDNKGWITIGIGFNLGESNRQNRLMFLRDYLGLSIADPGYAALDEGLALNHLSLRTAANGGRFETPANDALIELLTISGIQAGLPADKPFGFLLSGNSNDVDGLGEFYDRFVISYEEKLNDHLRAVSSPAHPALPAIPLEGSTERLVLLSLFYNAAATIGRDLVTALQVGDRFAAWYQIRFRINKHKEEIVAQRRYLESQVFGLYDTAGQATLQEAAAIFRGLTPEIRRQIDAYEERFGTDPDSDNPDVATNQILTARNYGYTAAVPVALQINLDKTPWQIRETFTAQAASFSRC